MEHRGLRAVLVGRDEGQGSVLALVTGTAGIRVEWLPDSEDALEAVARGGFDVVLVDEQVGLTFLRESRLWRSMPPIIVLGGRDAARAAAEAGAADCVDPANSDVLIRSIVHAVERADAARALAESEERYMLAATAANDGLWDWSLTDGEIGFSPRWKALLGYAEAEIGSDPEEWLGRIHPEDVEQVRERLALHLREPVAPFESEHRMIGADGEYRWVFVRGLALRDLHGTAYRMAGSMADVSHRRIVDAELARKAFYDPLTGLPNRSLFLDHLGRAVLSARKRRDHAFAVLCVDLDRFKVVNDSLGHGAGDRFLVEVAERLKQCLRPADTVARPGGDEFVLLLEPIRDSGDAQRVADRIQRELALPYDLDGHEVFTTASIGIAVCTEGVQEADEMLRDADIAMYRAKARGGGRYEIFDAAMHARAMHVMRLENDLRRAVEREEFVVHYQPIVELDDTRLMGLEALIRWQHPHRGLVLPDEFIPLAEETGLIVPIGKWALLESCRQMRDWQVRFPAAEGIALNVNISSRQFSQPGMLAFVEYVLAETGLDPSILKIEITESLLLENAESAITLLTHLKAMGIQLHVDDFGTGYSSLSYLHKLPIDTLKIDRSFVGRIGNEEGKNLEIVRAIVALAHSLGLDVIAEGIETVHQRDQLRELKCERAQGFLFQAALGSADVEALFARWGSREAAVLEHLEHQTVVR